MLARQRKLAVAKSASRKKREWWQRLAIISSFLSSVVIGAVGLLITFRIQTAQQGTSLDIARSQIASSELVARSQQQTSAELARAQNAAAASIALVQQQTSKAINDAQIASSRAIADLQQGTTKAISDAQITSAEATSKSQQALQKEKFAADLFNDLFNDNPTRRIFAMTVLRSSTESELYVQLLTKMLHDDKDQNVREEAARLLGATGTVQEVSATLASFTVDTSRTPSERRIVSETLMEIVQKAKATTCNEKVESSQACHQRYPAGCSRGSVPAYDAYLNVFKNLVPSPGATPVAYLSVTEIAELNRAVPATLDRGNHAAHLEALTALGEGRVYGMVAYLYAVRREGAESANCQLTAPDSTDLHLEVGFDAEIARSLREGTGVGRPAFRSHSVIIEITPHYRDQYHPNWTFEEVRRAVGKQVKIVGQLLFDNEHFNVRDDCSRPGANEATCWRASVWEIHPVTQLSFCTLLDKPCAVDSSNWQGVGDVSNTGPRPAAPD